MFVVEFSKNFRCCWSQSHSTTLLMMMMPGHSFHDWRGGANNHVLPLSNSLSLSLPLACIQLCKCNVFDWLSSVHTVTPSFVRLGTAPCYYGWHRVVHYFCSEWMTSTRGFECPPATYACTAILIVRKSHSAIPLRTHITISRRCICQESFPRIGSPSICS